MFAGNDMSFERSLISIAPSGCQTARSPERHQPSTSVFAVALVLEITLHDGIAADHDLATVSPPRGTLVMVSGFATLTSSTVG
jgi:hypothetical protein